tara:strand:- start:389 stop:2575 length:2187 start_codon:yes stop_codon:yes gene_type:complete
MSTRGIFSLGTIEERIREDSWVSMPTVWGGDTRYDGKIKINYNTYFTGGNGNPGGSLPERTSYADKIVMTTDTSSVVPSARLPFDVGMTDDGYNTPSTTVSWWSGNQRTRVYKLTYATESQSSSPTGTFANGPGGDNNWVQKAAVGNDETGYFGGGDQQAATSKIQKITFSEETFANLPSTGYITSPSRIRMSTTGTPTRGYFTGGYPSSQNSSRLEYSTDTITQISPSSMPYFSMGSNGTDTAGYFSGGESSPHNGFTGGSNDSEKLIYSTETFTATPTLNGNYAPGLNSYWGPGARRGLSGAGSKEHGYLAGGLYPSPSTPNDYRSWVDKVDFATETASRRIANIQNPRAVGQMGTGPRKNALATYDPPIPTPTPDQSATPASPQSPNIGYMAGGASINTSGTTVDKLQFSNGTTARIPGLNLSPHRYGAWGYGSKIHAFIAGGKVSPGDNSKIDRITYATDTISLNVAQNPSPGGGYWAKSTQTKTHGYWWGKEPGGYYTWKHPFATDTIERLPDSSWSQPAPIPSSYPAQAKRGSTSFNNADQTAGYAMSGHENPGYATDKSSKLVYATDTWQTGNSLNMWWDNASGPNERIHGGSGAASATKGYQSGGGPSRTSTNGQLGWFVFSTETWGESPAGVPNTSYYYYQKGVLSNQAESYWMGGQPGPSMPGSGIPGGGDGNYKLTHASDTWSGNWEGGIPEGRASFATASPRMFQNDQYIPQDNLL